MRAIAASLLTLLSSTAVADPLVVDPHGADFELEGAPRLDELWPVVNSLPADLSGFDPQGVVNGTVVSISDYENVVALAYFNAQGAGGVFCSGSLIDQEWVLTAAHCLVDLEWVADYGMDLYVLFGADIYTYGGITDAIEFVEYYPHPQYNGDQFINDIGVLHLSRAKIGVDLAVLNDESVAASWYGSELTTLGFGITSDNANDGGTKRVTELPIYDHDSQYIYTYDEGTNVCQGDSGGPAFEVTSAGALEQAGVNAFVAYGCVGGSAGLTRVDVYVPWIQGYVPNVLLSGTGEGSGGDDPSGGGSSGEPVEVEGLDPDTIDRDLGSAPLPSGYPLGVRCSTGPSGAASGWLVALGLLFVRRRLARNDKA